MVEFLRVLAGPLHISSRQPILLSTRSLSSTPSPASTFCLLVLLLRRTLDLRSAAEGLLSVLALLACTRSWLANYFT